MSKSRHKKPVSRYSVTEIKHLLSVDTLSERLLLLKLLAASKFHLTFHEEYGHMKGCTHA